MENQDIIPSIIVAAVAAAGPKGSNDAAWKAKINDAIPHIAAMAHEGTRQWRIAEQVLGAAVFVAEYVDHHVEDTSKRCLVHIDTGKPTKNYPDGIEPIRTHRTDNAQGKAMKARLDSLTKGDEIVVWKALEQNDSGDEKYRVLVHFETRPKRHDTQQRNPNGSVADTPPPSRSAPADESAEARTFNELDSRTKARVARALREAGISFPVPDEADHSRFYSIIDEEVKR